jgi:hypothetical protein
MKTTNTKINQLLKKVFKTEDRLKKAMDKKAFLLNVSEKQY